MARKPRINGLDGFQLSIGGLTRLGDRPVRLYLDLTGRSLSAVRHPAPLQRDAQVRQALAAQLERLRRKFPNIDFVSRAKPGEKPSWTIDAVVPARQVRQLASAPEVKAVWIDAIEGRRQKRTRLERRWFCVWGIVAIQVEGRVKGLIQLEDRFVLVKAFDTDDAQRRLQGKWSKYAEPYLNPDGYLVRWQLVEVRDVFELYDQTLDPRGTEVFSRLRWARIRPALRWTPSERGYASS